MKWKLAISAGVAVLVLGYWVATPYITAQEIKQAAEQKDAEALAEYVDFPSVRQSLKEQIKAAAMKEYSKDKELMENPFASLGIGLLNVAVDQMIDAAVTPAGVAQLATAGIPKIDLQSGKVSNAAATTKDGSVIQDSSMSYESLDKFSIKIKDKAGVEGKLVLRREGLFSWKLKDVLIQQGGEGSFFSKRWAPLDDDAVEASATPTAPTELSMSASAPAQTPQPTSDAGDNFNADDYLMSLRNLSYDDCMKQTESDHMGTNECLDIESERQDKRLSSAYQRVLVAGSDKDSLASSQEAWRKKMDEECDAAASEFEGGTMAPTVYQSCLVNKTTKRADELEAML